MKIFQVTDTVGKELNMCKCRWHVADSYKPIIDLIKRDQILDMSDIRELCTFAYVLDMQLIRSVSVPLWPPYLSESPAGWAYYD